MKKFLKVAGIALAVIAANVAWVFISVAIIEVIRLDPNAVLDGRINPQSFFAFLIVTLPYQALLGYALFDLIREEVVSRKRNLRAH